jgi:hypothetical protein
MSVVSSTSFPIHQSAHFLTPYSLRRQMYDKKKKKKPCNANVQAECFPKASHTRTVVCTVVNNMALSVLGAQRYRACADVWTIQQSSNNAYSLWSNAVDVMWVSLEAQQITRTACVRRLWPTGIGNLMGFFGGIYKRKAGSESLLQRRRQRIGGRDETYTLPLTPCVQRRLVSQLFRFFASHKLTNELYTNACPEFLRP